MSLPKRAVGVDIGGTKTAVALVDEAGKIHARETLLTEPEKGFPRALASLVEAISRLSAGSAVQGIGIGCAGPVDPRAGTIHNPYTLPGWDGVDIVTPLRLRFGVPALLENDADAALLGECLVGAGRGLDPVVMLTFGTGIGGAVVAGRQLYRGAGGAHPELGHVPAVPEGPECYCGARGCFESLASGEAIRRAGRLAGFAGGREVFEAAKRGDERAAGIVGGALRAVESASWTIIHTFVPEGIILGGGMMDGHFELFAEAMRRRIAVATQAPGRRIAVIPAALGSDAGVVGAAGLAFRS